MSQIFIKIIITVFFDITIIMIVKKLLKEEILSRLLKLVMWIFIQVLITLFLFETNNYNNLVSIVSILVASFMISDLFELKIGKALLVSILCGLVTAIPDLICSSIVTKFMTFETSRNNIWIMTTMSLINCIVTVSIFQISFIKKVLSKLLIDKKSLKDKKLISYSILVFFVVGLLYYFITNIYSLKPEYIISSIAIIIFVILSFVYSKERSEYDYLMAEYDVLYECVQEFEEWTESAQLNIHEYKNQLSKILDVTNDEKVLKIVNKIIKNTSRVDTDMLNQLKDLPKGGIKGLLYYKMIIAKNKNIQLTIDIGKNVNTDFLKLTEQEAEDLSKLIGIYFDNAIEAVEKTDKSKICLEIYSLKNALHFVFSNPIIENIDLEKIHQKGTSSKGKGRGNGLFFASKIIKSNERFSEETQKINDYYIQRISINLQIKKD